MRRTCLIRNALRDNWLQLHSRNHTQGLKRNLLNGVYHSSSSTLKKIRTRSIFHPLKFTSYRTVPSIIQCPHYITCGDFATPSSPEIKTEEQITKMRAACQLASSILRHVGESIKIGMTTDDIDALVHSRCVEAGAYPSPLRYKGFPKSVCTSVNHVACHGIPGPLVLQDGDIINVDVTVFYQGYHGDTSQTFMVGNVDEKCQLLVQAARDCRDAGIDVCKDGAFFSDIGEAIYSKAQSAGFQVIPNFCGHGIGEYFHGPPDIIHVPTDSEEESQMMAGMTFTIEPIICDGSPDIKILDDGWTVVTVDNCRSAQFEHTILVTTDGYNILTL